MTKEYDIENAFKVYPAARLDDLKAGDTLFADDGFTCMQAGVKTVREDEDGLYIPCADGSHYLDGQLREDGTLAGLVKLPSVMKRNA
jgi:hypothetical protein